MVEYLLDAKTLHENLGAISLLQRWSAASTWTITVKKFISCNFTLKLNKIEILDKNQMQILQ
jgi:hypothetical protein